MPTIPPGRLTRAQIVGLALRRAGNPVLGAGPNFEAQTWLNQILYDVYTIFTWPFLRAVAILSTGGATLALPSDFLSATQDDDALALISENGTTTYRGIAQLDPGTFFRVYGPGTSTGSPRWWTVDPSATTAQIYPVPVTTCSFRLQYQSLPAEIPVDTSGDATVPTFPWSDYLVQELAARVMQYEMDPRAPQEMTIAQAMLSKMMQKANALRTQSPVIDLDRQIFGDYGWDGRGPYFEW